MTLLSEKAVKCKIIVKNFSKSHRKIIDNIVKLLYYIKVASKRHFRWGVAQFG